MPNNHKINYTNFTYLILHDILIKTDKVMAQHLIFGFLKNTNLNISQSDKKLDLIFLYYQNVSTLSPVILRTKICAAFRRFHADLAPHIPHIYPEL